jgi:hypothetical protein
MGRKKTLDVPVEQLSTLIKKEFENTNIFSKSIVEYITVRSISMKKMLNFLHTALLDMTVEFSTEGMKYIGTNADNLFSVKVTVDASKFDCYKFNNSEPYQFCIRSQSLHRIVKGLITNTFIKFCINKDKDSELYFEVIDINTKVTTIDKIATIISELHNPQISFNSPDHVIIINSECLLKQLNKIVDADVSNFVIHHTENGKVEFMIFEKTDAHTKTTKFTEHVPIALKSIDSYVKKDMIFCFNVKSLIKFLKGLSTISSDQDVSLNFSNDMLMITYCIDNFADVNIYVKKAIPKLI